MHVGVFCEKKIKGLKIMLSGIYICIYNKNTMYDELICNPLHDCVQHSDIF